MENKTVRDVLADPSTWADCTVHDAAEMPNLATAIIVEVFETFAHVAVSLSGPGGAQVLCTFEIKDPTLRHKLALAMQPGMTVAQALAIKIY